MLLLFVGLAGGFVLAVLSIKYQYTGALACWTVVFTPIGTAVSIVLARIVDKSRAENTGADGEGIKPSRSRKAPWTARQSERVKSPAGIRFLRGIFCAFHRAATLQNM